MAPRFFHGPARWLAPDSGLSASERLVLAVLCLWTDRSTGECFPKVATIASHAALSERTVRSAIGALARAGAITIRRRRTDQGLAISSVYTVLGYDPTTRELAEMGKPITALQPLRGERREATERGANDSAHAVQALPTNVVKDNTPVNTPAIAAAGNGGVADWEPKDVASFEEVPKGWAAERARQMISRKERPGRPEVVT